MGNLALKIDLHVHTCYSSDGVTTLREVAAYAKRRGLDGVAITDHDTVEGALKLQGKKGLIVVPGIEVTTLGGHVLALNVTSPVPSGLTLSQTIQKIHEINGVAVMAHPFALLKVARAACGPQSFDAIEVINASTVPFAISTHLSRRLAFRLNLPQVAGSDAHYGPEIGSAYTLVNADPEADEVAHSIKKGAATPFGRAIPWRLRLKRMSLNLKKKLK
ncbi:MAG: PHP domain-containing protein [Candidatus Bathyarchaeota archaeon]|nr:MAG: PHP domain-containing protein [Candidatus Bathyarchaeota archaeon]